MAVSDELRALHARILAGEITKKEAAALAGVSYAHLCVRLSRAGLIDSVRTPRTTAKYDSPAMSAAIAEALSLPATSCNNAAIARKYGLPSEQYVPFSSRVLYARRAEMKKALLGASKNNKSPEGATSHEQRNSGAAAPG